MLTALQAIVPHLRGPFDTIVHIGAGDGSRLGAYSALAYRRLVLVEGDTQSLVALRAHAPTVAGAEVMEAVVAARAGTGMWFQCSLPGLNGLIDPRELAAVFPRLLVRSETPVTTVAIADLIRQLALSASSAATNLLILEVPGQEAALIEALPGDGVALFAHIAVQGCSALAGGKAFEAATQRLHALHFIDRLIDCSCEPLWPVAWLAFDADIAEKERLHRVAGEQAVRIDALCAEVEDLRLRHAAASDAAALSESRRNAEHSRTVRLLIERMSQVWEQQRLAEGELHAARILELESRLTDADQVRRTCAELTARLAEVEAEFRATEAQVAACEAAVAHRDQLLADCAQQTASLQDQLSQTLAQLAALRGSQAESDQEVARRRRVYEDQMLRAQSQMELVKDLLLRGDSV
jgi:hypothetical protein